MHRLAPDLLDHIRRVTKRQPQQADQLRTHRVGKVISAPDGVTDMRRLRGQSDVPIPWQVLQSRRPARPPPRSPADVQASAR